MTNDKKKDDPDRKKVSDEEMEDVAGGVDGRNKIARFVGGGNFDQGKKKPGNPSFGQDMEGDVF